MKQIWWRVIVKRDDKTIISSIIKEESAVNDFVQYWKEKGCRAFLYPFYKNK